MSKKDLFATAEAEQQAKEALLSKEAELKEAQEWKADKKEVKPISMPSNGYTVLPLENMPSGGKFYNDGFSLQIKSATVKDIRHYSSINENDPVDIYDKIDFIIKNNTKIDHPKYTYKDILTVDRYYVLYSIRQLTFKDQPQIVADMECSSCGAITPVNISRDNLMTWELDERIDKCFDDKTKSYKFNLKQHDLEFHMYIPTIGTDQFVTKYIRQSQQNDKFLEESFIKMAQFLIPNYKKMSKDTLSKLNKETLTWSNEQIPLVMQLVDIFHNSLNWNVQFVCKECSEENDKPMSFRGGLKEFFVPTTNVLDFI